MIRAKLQLVGVTCMLIAAKYEEIYAPQVDEFCYITDNTYDRSQVLGMERTVRLPLPHHAFGSPALSSAGVPLSISGGLATQHMPVP